MNYTLTQGFNIKNIFKDFHKNNSDTTSSPKGKGQQGVPIKTFKIFGKDWIPISLTHFEL